MDTLQCMANREKIQRIESGIIDTILLPLEILVELLARKFLETDFMNLVSGHGVYTIHDWASMRERRGALACNYRDNINSSVISGQAQVLPVEEVYEIFSEILKKAFVEYAGGEIIAIQSQSRSHTSYLILGDFKHNKNCEFVLRRHELPCILESMFISRKHTKRAGEVAIMGEDLTYTNYYGLDFGLRRATKQVYDWVQHRLKE